MVVVSALLITWVVTAGGGGGGKKRSEASNGKNPAHTITPGPSSSGPAISQHPGGRDESGGGGSGSSSGDDGGSGSAGSSSAGSSGSGGGASSGVAGGGSVVAGDVLPASSPLPNCTSSAVALSLKSLHNSYSPDQTPAFQLTAKNGSSTDCKIDLGPKNAVLAITPTDGGGAYWTSSDCPRGAAHLVFRVPAGQSITYTVQWDRRPSAPQCATPAAGSAKADTYLLQAKTPGFGNLQTSFVLSAD
ncbi:hypothetical protein GQF42_24945 [Streptomyces broussonetiae]|uniref:DUF4232 domain-containing protein n=1 Tax=Streptomyces broussonetiae TaxID=2686304 RepID=A0A6I6NEH7_9ACTN|nr:hypothetical protein GQF42_24945 [Streptomyces broussonetiae]